MCDTGQDGARPEREASVFVPNNVLFFWCVRRGFPFLLVLLDSRPRCQQQLVFGFPRMIPFSAVTFPFDFVLKHPVLFTVVEDGFNAVFLFGRWNFGGRRWQCGWRRARFCLCASAGEWGSFGNDLGLRIRVSGRALLRDDVSGLQAVLRDDASGLQALLRAGQITDQKGFLYM